MTKGEVDACTILRGVAGSRMLGLENEDSDTDILGVCVEPMAEAMGVGTPFEQWVDEKEQTQIYGLRKFVRLVVKGNPSMLALLFMSFEGLQKLDHRGRELQTLAPQIVSRACSGPFLGYLQAQRERMMHKEVVYPDGSVGRVPYRGQRGVRRKDLEELYGFDTKYAMHMLRLGMQGVELLTTGQLCLPMAQADRTYLKGVRNGMETEDACLARARELEAHLQDLYTTSPLRDRPDVPAVEGWMTRTYLEAWNVR